MEKPKIKLIPIAEFDGIENDPLLYVLGGAASNSIKPNCHLTCQSYDCDGYNPGSCVDFGCGCFNSAKYQIIDNCRCQNDITPKQ